LGRNGGALFAEGADGAIEIREKNLTAEKKQSVQGLIFNNLFFEGRSSMADCPSRLASLSLEY
jgi:hypothetical protein